MSNKLLIIILVIFSLLLIGIFLIVFVFNHSVGTGQEVPCLCDVDLNCGDFTTQAEAQACFEFCGPEDVHNLDNDGDGVVCEGLE